MHSNHHRIPFLPEVTTIPADSYSVASQPQKRHLRHRWPWELLYTFCDCLATVCLHGACSDVQKFSLLGMNEKTFKRYKSEIRSQAGLIEFLEYGKCDWGKQLISSQMLYLEVHQRTSFVSQGLQQDGGGNRRNQRTWSKGAEDLGVVWILKCVLFPEDGEDGWKVRYGAVKSLVRVCRHYSNDVSKEGVTNTAWSALVQHESSESEPRVLEAMKIAKVNTTLLCSAISPSERAWNDQG